MIMILEVFEKAQDVAKQKWTNSVSWCSGLHCLKEKVLNLFISFVTLKFTVHVKYLPDLSKSVCVNVHVRSNMSRMK